MPQPAWPLHRLPVISLAPRGSVGRSTLGAVVDAHYQSLYRRYRPQRFSEILGQDHTVLALRNAVRDNKVAHAYLFSGPRGTGKTSAARILAKALNCENSKDGEPDDSCESCQRIRAGTSLDVHELDAASNNGVDAMRDLVARTALGTPGRRKVYIVDEVHMLSTAASNALLKTVEEPPPHVIFVLATTDPQKVLPTIRSRTQHFEFRLLSPELLGKLVHGINGDANLHVPEEALDLAVRRGKGSARDTLSVLDQVSAAGIVDDENEVIDEIMESLCERDTGRALIALGEAVLSGRDPQRVAVDVLEYLRNGFLALMAKQLVGLPDNQVARVEEQARRLGAPALVRAMEVIGDALQNMRDAPEPRVTLEVALVRITKPQLDAEPAALLERIERLERGVSSQTSAIGSSTTESRKTSATAGAREKLDAKGSSATSQPSSPPNDKSPETRPTLGALRGTTASTRPTATIERADIAPTQANETDSSSVPSRDQLVQAWGDSILELLPQRARSRYRMGRFVEVDNGMAVFGLPNSIHRDRCEEVRNEVEAVLREHFGVRVPLRLEVESDSSAQAAAAASATMDIPEEEIIDLTQTSVAEPAATTSPEQRLIQAFPGAEEMR